MWSHGCQMRVTGQSASSVYVACGTTWSACCLQHTGWDPVLQEAQEVGLGCCIQLPHVIGYSVGHSTQPDLDQPWSWHPGLIQQGTTCSVCPRLILCCVCSVESTCSTQSWGEDVGSWVMFDSPGLDDFKNSLPTLLFNDSVIFFFFCLQFVFL